MKTVLFLLATSVALARFDSGQISGFVRDASQAVVPGATVTAVNQGNGDQRQTVSNASGYYVFQNLVVGAYTVSAEASGFKTISQTDVKLSSAAKISFSRERGSGRQDGAYQRDASDFSPHVALDTRSQARLPLPIYR